MYMFLKATILILLHFHTQVRGAATRVVGGSEAGNVFGKYQASLQNLTGHHVCGGAIISKQHVITAAHCVWGADPQYVKIVVGTSNLNIGGIRHDVSSIEVYKGYNTSSRGHDIAVIKATDPFDLRYVEVLNLDVNELGEGDLVILSAFGALEPNGQSSFTLHELLLNVFCQETCQYAMRYTREVKDSMFCTFNMKGQGTCHGDSGSPLVKDNQLVGIVSWGIPCAVGFPDVHTRITPYISWILEQISS